MTPEGIANTVDKLDTFIEILGIKTDHEKPYENRADSGKNEAGYNDIPVHDCGCNTYVPGSVKPNRPGNSKYMGLVGVTDKCLRRIQKNIV